MSCHSSNPNQIPRDELHAPETPPNTIPAPDVIPQNSPHYPESKTDFASIKPRLVSFPSVPGVISLSFNTDFTRHYDGQIPKAPILDDYPSSGQAVLPWILIVANLGDSFEGKLPQELKNELTKIKREKGNLDIFWVVQNSANLGEKTDHANIPTTTRLKPHGWADPDAPPSYDNYRINREFRLGIFDAEHDISTPVFKVGNMTPSLIQVHHGLFSPRTATSMVKLGSNDPSQAFWSLIIDDKNPEGKVRAIATLHWILSNDEWNALDEICIKFVDTIGKPGEQHGEPNVAHFGELREKLNSSSAFKGTVMLRKLNAMFE